MNASGTVYIKNIKVEEGESATQWTPSINDLKVFGNVANEKSKGLMSSEDKVKLGGIEDGANNYTLPVASTNELGGIKI